MNAPQDRWTTPKHSAQRLVHRCSVPYDRDTEQNQETIRVACPTRGFLPVAGLPIRMSGIITIARHRQLQPAITSKCAASVPQIHPNKDVLRAYGRP